MCMGVQLSSSFWEKTRTEYVKKKIWIKAALPVMKLENFT